MARFVLLYLAMYGAFGVASPFMPAFLHSRGLSAEALGAVLAAGTAVRLVAAPLAGRLGDRVHALRTVLVASACAALVCTCLYFVPGSAGWPGVVYIAQAAALAPTAVLADALAIGRAFEYGRVRGAGSAAFVAGTLVSGQAVAAWGLGSVVVLQAILLGGEALAASRVPERSHAPKSASTAARVRVLLRIRTFRWVVVAAALVLGSHAMQDGFAVIRWSAAGIGPGTASVLWSEAVAAEVLVFFFAGPALLGRLGPGGAVVLAALAGVLRWAVMAASAALTLASGALYGRFGAPAFWAMAALCAAAFPVGSRLARARAQ